MKRGRALAAGVGAAGALLMAWWLSARPPAGVVPAPSSAPVPTQIAQGSAPPAARQAAASAPPRVAAFPALPSASAPAAGVWDLCGIGRLPRPVAASAPATGNDVMQQLPPHLGDEATAAALERTLAVLDRGDARQRAAAILLRGADAAERPASQALPALAQSSNDPVVAQWALDRCRDQPDCRRAMADRWTQLEPDNAASWLGLIQEQPQRRAELMRRLLPSGRFDFHASALVDTVAQAIPIDVLPYVQINVWVIAIGAEAALGWPPLEPATSVCRPPVVPGSERQAECRTLARLMMHHADTLVVAHAGTRLADAAGLPRRETEARQLEIKALSRASAAQALAGDQPYSCAAYAQTRSLIDLRARLGEVEALRAWSAAAVARR